MQEFFRTAWWTRAGCDELQPSLAMLHFDTAVNMGALRAVVILQKQLGLPADGWPTTELLGRLRTGR